jgi:hypothetical protein
MTPENWNGADEQALSDLFRSYRQATDISEVSPNFMPILWQRIEARRKNSLMVERLARVFAGATVALAVVTVLFVSFEPARQQDDSWVEALANHHLAQNTAYYEPVRLSNAVDQRSR